MINKSNKALTKTSKYLQNRLNCTEPELCQYSRLRLFLNGGLGSVPFVEVLTVQAIFWTLSRDCFTSFWVLGLRWGLRCKYTSEICRNFIQIFTMTKFFWLTFYDLNLKNKWHYKISFLNYYILARVFLRFKDLPTQYKPVHRKIKIQEKKE